jgi:hypothetical protein
VELSAVVLIGGEIVFGQNDGLAGEAVAQGVEPNPALAFGGYGSGGACGIFAVDGGSRFSDRCGWVHENTSIRFRAAGRAKWRIELGC